VATLSPNFFYSRYLTLTICPTAWNSNCDEEPNSSVTLTQFHHRGLSPPVHGHLNVAERERDQAVRDLEEIEGTFGEEDLREYCEVCNHHWHREYVTWFAHPFETEDGRYVNSACGGCFRQVPVGHGPVV